MQDNAEFIKIIAEQIARGGRNVFFTGAGISTESGISDYRSKGGIWDKFRPVYFDEFMTSRESRIQYWHQKHELFNSLQNAKPNPAHMALWRLYEMGLLEAVITQNIDGLHQASGLPQDRVIELHGNTTRIRCTRCGNLTDTHETHARIDAGDPAPECRCGGYLKPDTISFGQSMPAAEVDSAISLSTKCDFFGVVGSTLIVQPAAHMPYHAKNNGAFMAIINLSETPCDNLCDVLIRAKAGEVMQKILNEVKQLNEA